MAATYYKHGITKVVPTGFSWTTLLFGFFVPLFRGDLKWCIIMILIGLITGGLSIFIFPFFYNKVYQNELIKQGYSPTIKTHYNL